MQLPSKQSIVGSSPTERTTGEKMSDTKSIEEMLKAFIEHGMDVSYFKFMTDYDKENFFMMYVDLFTSMTKESEMFSFHFTDEKDLFIEYEGKEMYLFVIQDYQTLKSDLVYYDPDDYRVTLMLSILFLTIKELKGMIDMLADGLMSRMQDGKISSKSNKNLTSLPKSFIGKANYFSSKIETIMDNIEENRNKITIKEV